MTATLLTVSLVAFVGVLLAGNSLVSKGVSEGGGAVSRVLPEVARIRDEAVEKVMMTVMGKYGELLQRVYGTLG